MLDVTYQTPASRRALRIAVRQILTFFRNETQRATEQRRKLRKLMGRGKTISFRRAPR